MRTALALAFLILAGCQSLPPAPLPARDLGPDLAAAIRALEGDYQPFTMRRSTLPSDDPMKLYKFSEVPDELFPKGQPRDIDLLRIAQISPDSVSFSGLKDGALIFTRELKVAFSFANEHRFLSGSLGIYSQGGQQASGDAHIAIVLGATAEKRLLLGVYKKGVMFVFLVPFPYSEGEWFSLSPAP